MGVVVLFSVYTTKELEVESESVCGYLLLGVLKSKNHVPF